MIGTVTQVNAPGDPLSDGELDALVEATVDALADATWLVGCGSLPDGAPATFYRTLAQRAHEHGVRVAIDTSGTSLEAALAAAPDVVKPNLSELIELLGRPLHTIDE